MRIYSANIIKMSKYYNYKENVNDPKYGTTKSNHCTLMHVFFQKNTDKAF